MKVFKVKFNDKTYYVEAEEVTSGIPSACVSVFKPAPVTANIKKPGVCKDKAIGGSHVIKAPLPGLIAEISIETGKAVKQGEKLLVLEAMKMENAILAPVSGIVDKISVKVGDSVCGNQEMIVIKS